MLYVKQCFYMTHKSAYLRFYNQHGGRETTVLY